MKRLTMIAGPHGVGKTTLMSGSLGRSVLEGTYIDPQEIFDGTQAFYNDDTQPNKSPLNPSDRAKEKAFSTRFHLVRKGRDLSAECSLGDIEDLDLLDAARKNGFRIRLVFLGVKDWQTCRDRILSTPQHWLSKMTENDIYGNYHRSLAMLPGAIPFADEGIVYDNSRKIGPHGLLQIVKGRVEILEQKLPEWIVEPLTRCL